MQALYEQVARAARSTISVLILGETGVGKDVLARTVHDRSPPARAPFLSSARDHLAAGAADHHQRRLFPAQASSPPRGELIGGKPARKATPG